MINAIAIDDEPLALKIVENFCAKTNGIELLKTFTSQEEAKNYLENYPVDLIFLDIQMPNQDGISFYKQLKQKAAVIFTTAYDNFAVEGFNVDAVDYLVKPYSHTRFATACEKATRFLNLPQLNEEEGHLFLRADHQLHKIMLNDIIYIRSDDDYIHLYFANAKPKLFRFTLKDILNKLPAERFIRIHRSFVVQLARIEKIASKAVFVNGQELPLGTNYEQDLKKKFK